MTKLIWVVEDPSPTNAGITIRINPIIKRLNAQRVDVSLVTYKDVVEALLNGSEDKPKSIYLFSKPHKSEYLSCMLALQNLGYRVGIDIFDNYYSESDALREFGVQSIWKNILNQADFCVFSTPYLLNYASSLMLDPKHMYVISDPVYPDWYEPLNFRFSTKWEQLFGQQKHFDAVWFGVDSNPYFFAGLSDIYCNISQLRDFLFFPSSFFNKDITHSIHICTRDTPDSRRLVIELNKIGINAKFVKWSIHECANLLENSHAVFLPTSNSNFILSKTHNRLVEALAHNCLVCVSPNSLYTQYKSLFCIDSNSGFANFLERAGSDNDISANSRVALDNISTLVDSEDGFSCFCEHLTGDNNAVKPHREYIFSLVGTIKDADNIKILRRARAIIAGVISPLVKSPPSFDHIELIHEDNSVRIRCNLDRIRKLVKIANVSSLPAVYRCNLQILPDTFLEFRQDSSLEGKFLELKLVDCGEAYRGLLKIVNAESIDKTLTFRNSHSRLLIGILYECLHHFCCVYLKLGKPVIVSGISPIGSFLDCLNETLD